MRAASPWNCCSRGTRWSACCRRLSLSPHRATRDVDPLGFGDTADDALLGAFRDNMAVEVDDGVTFDLKGLKVEAIREEVEYGGSRLRTTAALAGARIPINRGHRLRRCR